MRERQNMRTVENYYMKVHINSLRFKWDGKFYSIICGIENITREKGT